MSPLTLSVAQRCAQLVKQTVESALSGVGQVAKAIQRACGIAESAIVEATSVRSQVESRVASLLVQAEASTAHAINALSECIKEAVAHMEERMPHIVGAVANNWEKRLKQMR